MDRLRFVAVAALAGSATIVAGQSPDASALRDRLDAYLAAYEPRLSELVAEETLKQRELRARNVVTLNPRPEGERTLVSEVSFISLPADAGWLGFRRVVQMDGKRLADSGPTLSALLGDESGDDFEQAHLLLEESAKLNLGLPRTTNLPNLPLELLHRRHRHRFEHRVEGTGRIRGTAVTRLELQEISLPTIIQRAEGGDMPSAVTAWMETRSGRLIRAQVTTHDERPFVAAFDAVVWVDFKEHAELGMLVPTEMRETFLAGRGRDGVGVAKYSKYRKFRTSARVVPPVSIQCQGGTP